MRRFSEIVFFSISLVAVRNLLSEAPGMDVDCNIFAIRQQISDLHLKNDFPSFLQH